MTTTQATCKQKTTTKRQTKQQHSHLKMEPQNQGAQTELSVWAEGRLGTLKVFKFKLHELILSNAREDTMKKS